MFQEICLIIFFIPLLNTLLLTLKILKMPRGNDILDLIAFVAENEELIVGLGSVALSIFSPTPKSGNSSGNSAALNVVKGIAGLVIPVLSNSLTPNRRECGRKIPASEYIVNQMNPDQRQNLINSVSGILGQGRGENSSKDLFSLILNNPNMIKRVAGEIKRFLGKESVTCGRSNASSSCSWSSNASPSCSRPSKASPSCSRPSKSCCSRTKSCSKY